MLIIGHRGAAGLVAENTIRSFQTAQRLGVDLLEMDLRQRRDGQIVAAHDADESRAYPGAPTLQDVLGAVTVGVNLEIKETGFERQLLQIIRSFPSEVLISSFKWRVLWKIRTLDRTIKLGLIVGPNNQRRFRWIVRLLGVLRLNAIHPHYSLLNQSRAQWMRRKGYRIFAWVINTAAELGPIKDLGVDGVFTDRPDLLIPIKD